MKVCVNGTFTVEKIPPAVGIKPEPLEKQASTSPTELLGETRTFYSAYRTCKCSLLNCNVSFNIY